MKCIIRLIDRDNSDYFWDYEVKVKDGILEALHNIITKCNKMRIDNECDICFTDYFEEECKKENIIVERVHTIDFYVV